MTLWTLLPTGLMGLALTASVVRKATRSAASTRLRTALHASPRLWLTIGVLEGCGALGLLVGQVQPAVGAAAASGAALLMLGAIIAHFRVGLAGRRLIAPSVLLAVAVVGVFGFAASA